MEYIKIKGAREHNLKDISLEIPKNKLVVFTGLSGSGKSSLAFDTIYAEGQRRYVESLSSYARQFLGIMKKPDVDFIEGLSPAISIDQKGASHNPRSTVGTVTEIHDYLRVLYARIGHPHCPNCGREITHLSKDQITEKLLGLPKTKNAPQQKLRVLILSPIVKDRKGEYSQLFADLKKRGYKKVRIDGGIYNLDEEFVLIKTNKHSIDVVIDSLVLGKDTDKSRVANDVEQGLKLGNGEIMVGIIKDASFDIPDKPKKLETELYSEKFACAFCNISLPEIEPRIFSFNTPHGACETCNGLGMILTVDKDLILNNNLSINEGGLLPFPNISEHDTWFSRTILTFLEEHGISPKERIGSMNKEKKELLLNGTGSREYEVYGLNRWGRQTSIREPFRGIIHELKLRYQNSDSMIIKTQIEKFMRNETCPTCGGSRLKKEALSVTINNKSIVQFSNLSIDDALEFIQNIESKLTATENEIGKIILKEIRQRLSFLVDVGLEYLALSRAAASLSGGEAQRIRLASQIGSGLTGVLYVLDEPSIGLHQKDNKKLIETLKKLRDLGNTVIVVEHDQETMEAADYIFDFGPLAGEKGGLIVAKGTVNELKDDKNSLTGLYLSGVKKIVGKNAIIQPNGEKLVLSGVTEHNLKDVSVSFPLNTLTVVTGVSGSGKSTLIVDVLYHALANLKNPFHHEKPGDFKTIDNYEHIKNVFLIDQSPIGRTPRSNPATYVGCFSYIRDLFAKTQDARVKGFGPGRFSFNVRGGRCETCEGEGQLKIEMQFLPDVYITCESCRGLQYNHETLEVLFNDKNIAEVLKMTVSEARAFFQFVPGLAHKLQTLDEVGLSYIRLGQPAPTLSGGEAQRVKLATELSKRGKNAVYILDEPTTGLHFADLEKLLIVLRRLVDQGNTVIVIEHNLDVIKNADHVIDLGPDGGEKGGRLIGIGTPAEIAKNPESYTGIFLKKLL